MHCSSSHIPSDVLCAADYARVARRHLDAATWAHIAEGAGTERTLRANRRAFVTRSVMPRVLVQCAQGNTRMRLLGRELAHPLLLAPVSLHRLVHADGELATADGASAAATTMIVSTLASAALEDIAARARAGRWFQLYVQPRDAATRALLRRAEDAAYEAIVVTVDAPVTGPRLRSARLGFAVPSTVRAVNLPDGNEPQRIIAPGESRIFQGAMARAPSWDTVAGLVSAGRLPVLVKGVLHPDDAVRAIACGASGVIVSNHGGRALDGAPAALDCLPAIRAALGPDVAVLLDGGVRSGNDVFVARALGADAVLLGRLQLFALAVAGALGVAHLLRTLREELELTMALAGCPTLDAITREHVHEFGSAKLR